MRVPAALGGTEIRFTVALPTAPGTEAADFSAYAFNDDRVKSDTAHAAYRRPAVEAAPRRAFVVTIGIDAYDDPRLKLNFSANDARLVADRLAAIPDYEVHRLSLAGATGADGKTTRVTRADIVALLASLTGDGPDAARPDDIVIISFSGHGWADPAGNFYLFPADRVWPAGAAAPDLATLISSGDLAQLLLPVRAAEITLVIDACHSAASVAASGFKPGPMGDAGLGQLAFDKGIRILAASQADDVALESAVLRQGLLTFALASRRDRRDRRACRPERRRPDHDVRMAALRRGPPSLAQRRGEERQRAIGESRLQSHPCTGCATGDATTGLVRFYRRPEPGRPADGDQAMKRLLCLLALLAIPAATAGAPARPPVIRGLFVGIDKYLYSKPTNPDADFRDLKGAVGDVGRIKAAFGPRTGSISTSR